MKKLCPRCKRELKKYDKINYICPNCMVYWHKITSKEEFVQRMILNGKM